MIDKLNKLKKFNEKWNKNETEMKIKNVKFRLGMLLAVGMWPQSKIL